MMLSSQYYENEMTCILPGCYHSVELGKIPLIECGAVILYYL